MSRSRRKTPITGITTAETDKPFKVAEHRRERRAVKAQAKLGEDLPDPKQYGSAWHSDKDGKQMFDPALHPAYMRK